MRIAGSIEDQTLFKLQRQTDQFKKVNEDKKVDSYKDTDQKDQLSIKVKDIFKTNVSKIDGDRTAKPQKMVGDLTAQIKKNSIAASKSHSEIDPKRILSLFEE